MEKDILKINNSINESVNETEDNINENDIYNYTCNVDENKINSNDLIMDFKWFEKEFLELNPEVSKEELFYMLSKKKGYFYVNFENFEEYQLPNKEYCGEFMFVKRKIIGKPCLGNIFLSKAQNGNVHKYRYYTGLTGTPIGIMPIKNNKYLIVCKPKNTVYNIIFAIIFIRLMILQFLGK